MSFLDTTMGIRIAAQAVKAASTGSNPSTLKPGVITHAGMYTYHLGGGSRRTRNYRSSLSMSWLSDKQTMLSHHTSAGFSRSHRLEASSFYLLQVAGVLSLRGLSEGVPVCCTGGALARATCPVVANAKTYPYHAGHTVVSSCLLPQHGCAESLETWLPSRGRLPAWASVILTLTSTRGISYLIAWVRA